MEHSAASEGSPSVGYHSGKDCCKRRRFRRRHTETAPVTSYAGYSSGGVGYSSGGLMSGFNPGDGERSPSLSSLCPVETMPKTDELVQTAACKLCFSAKLGPHLLLGMCSIHSRHALAVPM